MKSDNEKLCNFMHELSSVLISKEVYQNFRIKVLKLIDSYYGYDKSTFIIYKNGYSMNYMESHLDNITYGLSTKMITEYYSKYYTKDPTRGKILSKDAIDIFEFIDESKYLKTDYYNKFMINHELYYQMSVGLFIKEKLVGHLSFYRSKIEGFFTREEKKELETIALLISIELEKTLLIRELNLQNNIYEEYTKMFPIAQIVLNKDHDVIYYNKYAKKYVEELSGAHIGFFKYFFVNDILGNNLFSSMDNERIIDSDNFIMKISRGDNFLEDKNLLKELSYVIFITKKITAATLSKTTNNYFEKLTDREKEISHLIQRGLTNDEIGSYLKISPFTVKSHIQRMYSKCNSNNRLELVNKLFREEN